MVLLPISSVVPPSGNHFFDESSGVRTRIDGDNPEDLAKRILEFRLNNNKPPGNPVQEIIDYVCGTWPHFCRETEPPVIPPSVGQQTASLATRCATWIAAFLPFGRTDKGISINESERRAQICAGCTQNKEFRGGCGACVENIERVFFIWRRDRPVPFEREPKACNVIGQHNGTAVLAEKLPELSSEVEQKLPANCWRKRT